MSMVLVLELYDKLSNDIVMKKSVSVTYMHLAKETKHAMKNKLSLFTRLTNLCDTLRGKGAFLLKSRRIVNVLDVNQKHSSLEG